VADQRKPKPRRRRLGRVLVSLAAILLLAAGLAGAAALYAKTRFEAPGPLAESRTFSVSRGLSTPEIARGLKEAGIISDDWIFLAAAYLTRNYRRMKAGEYVFPKSASMADVMGLIVAGKELVYKLTIPEGWTTAQVIERVSAHENLVGEIGDVPSEGAILPETYVFRRGMTRDGIIRQMRAAQEKLFDEMWARRAPNLPFETKEEALILASIVEKETAIPAERPQVAAVFVNRLRAGMRLQSDPTIIYGITLGKTKLDRPILKSDIEAKTPYNTYRIAGLPPTPIANPGKESLAAVLNPIESKALYFVADGNGGHVFAETLEQHRKNVRKWRVVEKSLAAEAEAAGEGAANDEPAQDQTANSSEPAKNKAARIEAVPAQATTASAEVPVPDAGQTLSLDDPPSMDEAAPAETSDYDAPERTAAVEPDAAPSAPAAEIVPVQSGGPKPGSLIVVSGRLVPIPVQRPRKN
jgi:UPF0755 protein